MCAERVRQIIQIDWLNPINCHCVYTVQLANGLSHIRSLAIACRLCVYQRNDMNPINENYVHLALWTESELSERVFLRVALSDVLY